PVEATAAPKAAPPDGAPNAAPPGPAAADPAPRPSAPADPALDPERLRAQVRQATKNYDYESGRKALVALAAVNPASLSRADLRRAAAEVVTGAEEMGKPGSDELFAALASAAAAPHGPDLLYDVVQLHGGRKSAKRALDLLRQPDVIARASPALRITVAFRDADCPRREGLAERAAAEGDARTLALIKVSLGGCGSSPPLEKAERALSLSTAPRLPARPASRAVARAAARR
ncbi:MAG TPA: hypothetical protein VFS00_12190, partial [Polyangiaceae bacterium]|nr:hypothetical protein [Polyangiaceae bacterium]